MKRTWSCWTSKRSVVRLKCCCWLKRLLDVVNDEFSKGEKGQIIILSLGSLGHAQGSAIEGTSIRRLGDRRL